MTAFARVLVRGASAVVALPLLVVVALGSRITTARRRRARKRPRLVWGPEPLISIKYWSQAMRARGYPSTTLVHGFYSIYRREDFDRYSDGPMGSGPLSRFLGQYLSFGWALRNADIHFSFLDGGFLRGTPLRSLEGRLLRLADKKLVVSPYGSDIAVPGYLGVTEEVLLQDYPHFAELGGRIKDRVDYFARWADVVVRNYQNGYLPRSDVVWITQLAIDVPAREPAPAEGPSDGREGELVVVHAPNHRHVKGTAALVKAVEELRGEGLGIRLDVFEKRPNEEVRKAIREADVVADQFVAGYAMFAVEGLAAAKPVISALSGMPDQARNAASMRECPIVDADRASLKENLRRLARDPGLRRRIGDASRDFAQRYHSLEAVGSGWEAIVRHLWLGDPLPPELPEVEPLESRERTAGLPPGYARSPTAPR